MKKVDKFVWGALSVVFMMGCGQSQTASQSNQSDPTAGLAPIEVAGVDNAVVHAQAVVVVSTDQQNVFMSLMNRFFLPKAYAATANNTVTYVNAANTNFSLNVSAFQPGSMTGNTLSLGTVAISALRDNNLRVCGTGGNTKCTQAVIRVYTTGTIAGFVNTTGGYGAPVYTGTLNPTSALGLNAGGSVQVQTLAIANNKNVLNLSDFTSPSYAVSSDFSNAGAGSYSMTYVVEYALLP